MTDTNVSKNLNIAAGLFIKEKQYWTQKLSDAPEKNSFHYDYKKNIHEPDVSTTVQYVRGHIDGKCFNRLIDLSRGSDPILHMVLAAAVTGLSAKYTGNKDIIIGTSIDKQDAAEGLVNTILPLRTQVDGNMTFKDLLLQIRQTVTEAIEHQNFPIETLLPSAGTGEDEQEFPLYDVSVILENIQDLQYISHINNSIVFIFLRKEELIEINVQYNALLYEKETLERILTHYFILLEKAVFDVNVKLDDIEIITEEEKKQLIDFNNTRVDYPETPSLHRLFERQAARTPDQAAVILADSHTTLSYKDLNNKANQLAHLLKARGVKPGVVVPLLGQRSLHLIIGMLGILKAGGAFLPMDSDYPGERKAYILEDSGAKIVLTTYPENSLDWVGEVLNITDAIAGDEENIANLENVPVQPNDLAYIIYTSGSTGKPKGVMIEHRGILDYSYWAGKHYVKDEPVNFPLFTSISFDLTMTSIFTPLTTGNAVVVYEGFTEVLLDRIIDDNQVAVIKLTPSHLNLIKENKIDVQRSVIKRFIVGGEILETKTAAAILENFNGSVEIINEYGPTEATVGCMRHTFDPRKDTRPSVPIGVPADNCRVYLLDGNQKPVPPGAVGEMYLAGKRLARGYWRQPGLTAESFITITADDGADMQMYRTGDLARWRPGGYLEFLGRADQQLKIRGFRIEPGEIESRLLEYEGIENAVVTAVTPDREKADPGDSGGQYLCAYFVSGLSLTMVQLKEFLSGKLPQYMIPTYFVQLPEIPLTPNGKVDKKALPQPGKDADTGEEYVAPRNEIEARLAKIWQELLGVEKVGINDSYFSRGGDSIKAIQIASRLQELNLKLEVRYLFQYPTIKGLSAYISETKQIIDQDAVEGEVKLTPIQEWFFRMNLNAPHHFNQAVMVAGPDGFDETAIREIFTKIIHHHDALRMIYKEENREITQVNCGLDYPIEMEVYDFKGKENAPELIEQESDRLQTSINLEKGPLMKLGLFHLDRGDRLLIVIHHLVIDGVSWRILFEDFESLYLQYRAGEPLSLPLKTDSFKLWADELTRYADSRELLKEKDFWAAMEDQVVEPIKKDFDEEKNYIKDTGSLSFSLTWEETERLLTKVNKAFGTQVNEILLTALGLGIEKTLGIKKPAVTLESHGREEIIKNVDIKRTVGWFTTVYPVLLDFSYGDDQIHLAHRIKETKETLRRVPNKGFNYGILKYLTAQKHKKDIRFKLNPQISFNYLGQFDTDTQKKSFISTNEPVGKMQDPDGLRQHLLEVTGIISGKQLSMSIIYNKKQFKTETMEALLNAYQTTLQQVISYCESRQKREWTPTDFTYRGLSIRTVDQLQKQYALEEIYALSPMQEGMLFHALYEEDTSMYFEQASFRLHGDLEETLLKKSLDQLLKRHDVLRTAIIYEGLDRPVQLVIKDRQAGFLYKDIRDPRHREEQNKDAYIEAFKQSDRQRSFLLAEDVLIRLAVLRTDEYQYQFVWSFHHVLMDGWCTTILVSEYFEIYKSLLENRAHHLPEIVPYRRFIQWLDTQDREVSRQFWTRYLAGYDEPAALPALEKFKKDGRRYHSQTYDFQLDKKTTNALNRLASVNQVTLNTLMQTVWGIIAAKYNRTDDAVFGAVVSGRPSEITGVETMVGLFINTVPVRINSRRHSLFNSLLAHVQEKALESEPHHYFPLAEIQALSPVKQNLLDHIVIFENYPISEQINDMLDEHETPNRPGEFKISHTTVFEKTNYDFNIIVVPREKILIKFEYNDNAYEIQSIERIAGYMKQVFETVIENPGISIHDIEILTEAEKKRLLIDFNCTRTQYPEDKTIHQLFEQQAQKTPERIAVMEPGQLSYGELNRKAHRLAHALEENGVKPGSIVSLSAERSMEIIVAIMGMLKAGAAYLPIDPEYPEKRKQYILSDSGTSLLITQTPGQTKTLENGSWKGRVIPLADLLSASEPVPASIDIEVRPADPVYVIYTSGSTGKPKGVMIRHRGLVNYICWAAQQYIEPYEPPVNFPLYSSLSFDLTVTSIFTPLITGNAVIVYQGEDKEFLLGKIIADNRIGVIKLTPSHLKMVKEQGIDGERSTVKAFIVGGEVLDTSLAGDIHEIFGGKTAIYNEYGPTETVVGCMIYKYDPGSDGRSSVPIGIPAANTGIYLLDNNRQPVPPGAGGELYISGHGVARGYINRPRLTTETFIDNPFEPGQTMYKSGDMARMLLDGNIEFLGRSDDQVKIRGFRIETGEIANRLTSHKDVKEAVVIQRERAGSQYLCAYIVPDAAGNPDLEAPPTVPEELKAYLAQELPDYMIPAFFVPIERIPLTPNGKINRHALPDPEIQVTESYEAPGNDIEEALTEIWREVLGLETVGINDNFFDIGGDSIKVIQIVSRLMRHKLHLEIKDLYSNPTIKQAAGFARPSDGTAEAEQGTITGNVKLTPIQNWFFKNHATNRHHYNQAVMIYRPEGFDEEYLHKIFEQIVHHHDALRMTYEINGARINQENRGFEEEPPDRLFDLEVFDLRHSTGVEAEIQQEAGRIQESIELDRGPLVKLGLFKTAEGDHLLIAVHHLVVDGVSWRILFEDFSILFGQLQKEEELKLPLKSTSFKEWAEKLSHYADSSALVQEIPYWRKIEQTHSPPLPKKSTALERKFKNYHTLSAQLSEEHTRMLLKDVNRAYNTEINDILLGALAAALKNWTGKTTALVDLEGHGRETIMDNVQIARTVGWFTSLFPVVLEMQDNHHTVDVIKNTKEMLRHIPNKGTGYGILKYLSADPRDLRFPLKPEISFNYLGKMDEDINTGIFRLSPFSPGDSADPEIEKTYSMDITGVIVEEKLNMSVKYHTGEFDEATISSFITGYMDALRQIIQHCRAAEGTEITESDMTASDFEEGEADSIFEELQEAFGN